MTMLEAVPLGDLSLMSQKGELKNRHLLWELSPSSRHVLQQHA